MIPRTNIDIYATVPAERRKAMNDAVITNENDEQRVMNLIFERTSLGMYPVILNAWQIWQWFSLIKLMQQKGHFTSLDIVF